MQAKPQPWLLDRFSRAAIQGERYSNSYNGWTSLTRGKAGVASYPTVDDAFMDLMTGAVDFAFIPVANSIAQQVPGVMRLLRDSGAKIIDEVILQINHCVIGLPGTDLGKVRTVMSHKVALGQCTRWTGRFSQMRLTEWFDTAGAARDVAAMNDRSQVAIAPRETAEGYGLEILAENVQDMNPNQTRFVVLAREAYDYSLIDCRKFRTALIFSFRNAGPMTVFDHDADLTKALIKAGHRVVEKQFFTGPNRQTPHAYYEVTGRDDERLRTSLSRSATHAYFTQYKVIGCFPEHENRLV